MNPEFLIVITPFLIVALIWSLVWKAVSLWIAARKGSKIWFIALLIVNTLGILEILYIFIFSKMGKKNSHTEIAKN